MLHITDYHTEYIVIVHHSSFVIDHAHIIPVVRESASLEPAALCAVNGYRPPFVKPSVQPFVKPFARPFVKPFVKPFLSHFMGQWDNICLYMCIYIYIYIYTYIDINKSYASFKKYALQSLTVKDNLESVI